MLNPKIKIEANFSGENSSLQSSIVFVDKHLQLLQNIPQLVVSVLTSHSALLKGRVEKSENKDEIDMVDESQLDLFFEGEINKQILSEIQQILATVPQGDIEKDMKIQILTKFANFEVQIFENILKKFGDENVSDIREEIENKIEQAISKIQAKLKEVFNWIVCFCLTHQNKKDRIFKIFSQLALQTGNRETSDLLHSFYLSKLLKFKTQLQCANGSFEKWVALKRQVSKQLNPNAQQWIKASNQYLLFPNLFQYKNIPQISDFPYNSNPQKNLLSNQTKSQYGTILKSTSVLQQQAYIFPSFSKINDQINDSSIKIEQYHINQQCHINIEELDIPIEQRQQKKVEKQIQIQIQKPQIQIQNFIIQPTLQQRHLTGLITKQIVPPNDIVYRSEKSENLKSFSSQKKRKDYQNKKNMLQYIKQQFRIKLQKNQVQGIELVKYLWNAQHLFMKGVIHKIVQLAKIANPRLNSTQIGNQIKYYCTNANIDASFWGNKIQEISKNRQNYAITHPNQVPHIKAYKLTYPSKLNKFFALKKNEENKQMAVCEQIKQQVNQNTRKNSHMILKNICEENQKREQIQFAGEEDVILTKRMKITLPIIKMVIEQHYSWMFASQLCCFKSKF